MKRIGLVSVLLFLGSSLALGAPLATAARGVIPKETQQVICVDYRSLKASSTALALKNRVLPPNMKEFESAVQSLGLDPDKDVESLTFATFRGEKGSGLRLIGIAQGDFSAAKLRKQFRTQKIYPKKYHDSYLYPATNGMQMTFLDEFTLLFGDDAAIKGALDARDGYAESIASNSQLTDLLNSASADSGAVWSVLDQQGTQNLMRSALGDAARLADYDTVKKRVLGSRYSMDFTNGVKFDLDVTTSDAMTASALSSLVKAGMLYRRVTATGNDKLAADNVTVDSDNDRLRIHFKADDSQFQTLLQSDLFAAVAK
jgi:hypothetical protein